jgi:hypothetical protein
LAQLVGERLERSNGAGGAEGCRIFDDLALIGRELIESGDDQCPQRVR